MKKAMSSALFLMFAIAGTANADQLCGALTAKAARAACAPGIACPAIMTLVYTVAATDGSAPMPLSFTDYQTLQDAAALVDGNVCVTGTNNGSTFAVTEITAQ